MNLAIYITPKVVIVLHQISERNDTRQAKYVKRDNEARSYLHCCHG